MGLKPIDLMGLAFSLICIAFCIFGLSRIQSNTEDVLQWLPDKSAAREKYDLFESKFGSDDFLVVTWTGCTVDDERLIEFTDHIREHDLKGLFQTITSGVEVLNRLSQRLDIPREHVQRRLRGVFFGAQDLETTCAFLELSTTGTANRIQSMSLVWDAVDRIPNVTRDEIAIGGYPYIATFIDNQLKDSFKYFLVPSVIISTLIALFCLRDIVLTLIVFVTAVGAAATSIAFIPICGAKYGGLMAIIPALVFVLATSGSIHLTRYSFDAIGDARKLLSIGWRPCVVSALTTAVGMLSLLRSDFPAIRNFGLYCATGVGFALMYQMVMVPWLLSRFGTNGFKKLERLSERSSFWHHLAGRIQRFKYAISAICLVMVILGGIGLTKLKAEVEVEKLFKPDSQILKSIASLESRLGPMDQTELLLMFKNDGTEAFRDSFPDRVNLIRKVQVALTKVPEVDVIYSLINFLPSEPRSTNARSFFKKSTYRNVLRRERENLANGNMLNVEGDTETWRISLRFPFTQKKDFDKLKMEVVDSAESALMTTATTSTVNQPELIYTGKTHLFHHAQLKLLTDLYRNFLLAFVIITPILIIVLRSISLGLIAMIPNLFPTLALFGWLGWMGSPVDLAIAMTACVALGIAVDDTTHFLIRFRDHEGGFHNIAGPISKTMEQCGPAMLHTTLIGGAGLFVYYFSSMLVVSRFSWAIATLLVIALLADILMLPAILFLFGPRDPRQGASAEDRKILPEKISP